MTAHQGIYYDFYDFRLDVEKQLLLKNGHPVQLTHKAFQILLLLVQNSGQTAKKEDIFNQLWSDSFVEDSNLTQHIYVLRKTLGHTPTGQSYIETVPKQGYRFTLLPGEISVTNHLGERLDFFPDETRDSSVQSEINRRAPDLAVLDSTKFDRNNLSVETIENFSGSTDSVPIKQKRTFSPALIIIALLLLFGGTTAGIYYFSQKPEPPSDSVKNIKSIAVLPFKPIGEEVDKNKFGLGIADSIITRLSNLQTIIVRPTSAVFSYTDRSAIEVIAAGRELGVDAVLEGMVQSDSERVRISVQLVRVADGKTLWAESFQESVSDIFTVQDSISTKVVKALSLNLTQQQEQQLAQRSTNSAEAFQAYQLGVYFWNKRSKADLQKAIEYFSQAVRHDPNYAHAYAGLADSYSSLGYFGFEDANEMRQKAQIAAEKSIALNNSIGEGYAAQALSEVAANDFEKALQLLERALILSPYNATARQRYGYLLIQARNLDEGTNQLRLAQEYDPLSPTNNKSFCNALIYQRKFSEAIKYCEKAVDLFPDTPGNRSSLAHAYFYAGRHQDALTQLDLETKSGSNFSATKTSLAYFYVRLGRKAEAEKIYEEMKKEIENDKWLPLTLSPTAYSLGKKEEAFELFKKAVEMINSKPEVATIIAYSPTFDEIKTDPQFASIIPR